ncbi:hypothetical protein Pmani_004734 [Petrolisthes manimaculis]|uniref:Uncharacterized protein n=1 Tax=Petrolisthes manimaculis TaxID=1843537 RepID=A0AAE1UL99_9EUCA|nr:hypothetical protein Pmani_004734 [Petrolisthes manimaculis]
MLRRLTLVALLVVRSTWANQQQLQLQQQQQQIQGQACRVYHINLEDDPPTAHKTPSFPLRPHHPLYLSLWVEKDGEWPAELTIVLQHFNISLLITEEGMCVAWEGNKRSRLLNVSTPTLQAHSWVTFVLALHAHTLVLYRSDQQHRAVSHRLSKQQQQHEDEVEVNVTSNKVLHLTFNCPTGCHIHDSTSPLIDSRVILTPPFTLYLLLQPHPQETHNPHQQQQQQQQQPSFILTPHNNSSPVANNNNNNNISLVGSEWKEGEWNQVNVVIRGQSDGSTVDASRGRSEVVEVDDTTYYVSSVKGIQWTIQCHPLYHSSSPEPHESSISPILQEQHTTGRTVNNNNNNGGGGGEDGGRVEAREGDKDETDGGGSGVGEIVAWLLTGLAFFLVLVLAFTLCTRMRPDNSTYHDNHNNPDYLASVGYLTQPRESSRELDEESEPSSPPTSPNTLAPPPTKTI